MSSGGWVPRATEALDAGRYLLQEIRPLNSAHQEQDNQNDYHQAQAAARSIAPTLAVGPGGKCAERTMSKMVPMDILFLSTGLIVDLLFS